MNDQQENVFILAFIAGCGMFLSSLDLGIINIAIPSLIKTFSTRIDIVVWSITSYTLVLSASILLFGRLADRWGCMKIYVLGIILFALSSLLCGTSLSIYSLIIFRGVQGLSAAMMQATSIALITTRLHGEKLNKAMTILGMLIGLGPMLGPVVGGIVLSTLGWRWIFWINIPICLLGLYGCYTLPKVQETKHEAPIHYVNLLLIALTLLSVLLTMSMLSQGEFGHAWKILIVAIITLIIYFYSERKAKHPMIPLKIFKHIEFLSPILGIIAYSGATVVAFILPPLYFEKLRHFQAWQVGFISFSAPLGIIISARFASKIVSRFGTIKPMVAGLIIMLTFLLILTQLAVSWPVWVIFLLLMFYGLGGGLFQIPCYLNIMAQFPKNRQAFISSLTRMLQNLAFAFESAAAALLISLAMDHYNNLLSGIRHAWLMSAMITLAALLTFSLQGKSRI